MISKALNMDCLAVPSTILIPDMVEPMKGNPGIKPAWDGTCRDLKWLIGEANFMMANGEGHSSALKGFQFFGNSR
jgi:hypothetical protein